MKAEFIYQPISGEYEEKIFDLNTVWKSPDWSWVKYSNNNGEEWVGAFRGEPVKNAVAEKINQVATLTSDGLFILDIDKKEVLYYDQQTELRRIIEAPTKDKFVVADFYQIGTIEKDFKVSFLDLDYDIDNVEFGEYEGKKLKVKFEKMPHYEMVNASLNTENWTLELE